MDMTVTRDLAKVYHGELHTADAIQLYSDTRQYYMLLPTAIKDDGDLDTPFDWYPLPPLRFDGRNELNIYLGFLLEEGNGPTCISTIHVTSRWLRGRYAETFWNLGPDDSREWDKDDTRRREVVGYVPGTWDVSRYTLPIEIRVRLGIAWLLVRNFDEAMVLPEGEWG